MKEKIITTPRKVESKGKRQLWFYSKCRESVKETDF